MKYEFLLKNGKKIVGNEIFIYGDLIYLTRIKKFWKIKSTKIISIIYSTDISAINIIDVTDADNPTLKSTFNIPPDPVDDISELENTNEEYTELPVSTVMYN